METPELDKIVANKTASQAIGHFLEWLQGERHICFCITPQVHYDLIHASFEAGEMTEEQCEEAVDSVDETLKYGNADFTYIPSPLNTEKVLAEFFGVDLVKAEEERQGLLDEIRANNG